MKLAFTTLTLALAAFGAQAGTFDTWTLNGSAHRLDAGDTVRLTQTNYQAGSAWAPGKVSLAHDFSVAFSFRLAGGTGADGITLTVQDSVAGSTAVGGDGEGLGYAGIAKSVAFVYDPWDNFHDIDRTLGSNTSVTFGGSLDPWGGNTVGTAYELRDKVVYSWVDYSAATGTFNMYISDTDVKPSGVQETVKLSQTDLAGSTQAYIGFTGATGGAHDNQDILGVSVSAVPEADAGVLALGGVALALALARRQGRAAARR